MITNYPAKRDRFQVGQTVDATGEKVVSCTNKESVKFPFGLFGVKTNISNAAVSTLRDIKLPAAAGDLDYLYGVAKRTLNALQFDDPAIAAATVDGYEVDETMNVQTEGTIAVPLFIREAAGVTTNVLKVAYGDTGFGVVQKGYLVQEGNAVTTPNCAAVKGIIIEDIDLTQVLEDHGADGKVVVAKITLAPIVQRA